MKNLENKTIVLDNNESYEIIENVIYKNRVYVYLVNIKDEMDSMFQELYISNNDFMTKDIEKKLFEEKILKMFIEKFEKY